MDDKFKRIEDKIDKLSDKFESTNERLGNIDKTVAVYNEQLKIHIEGTVQNRESLKIFQSKMESEIKPIASHVIMMNGALKLLGVLSLIAGFIFTLTRLFYKN